jgi:hypothetical protein
VKPRSGFVNLQSWLGLLIIVLLALITSPRSASGGRIFLEKVIAGVVAGPGRDSLGWS